MEYERDGKLTRFPKIAILGYDLDREKLFILSLSATSFSNFGQLVSRLKAANITKTFEIDITARSEKQENDKGKYWVIKFELGKALDKDTFKKVSELKGAYSSVLENRNDEEN